MSLRPPHIVMIEDRSEDRFFMRIVFEEVFPDCRITEFSYAEDALRYLRTANRPDIDLMFVDVSMPRMDGFEFADAFHGLYPEIKGHTRLFITSSSIDPNDRRNAGAHPAIDGFIEKPLNRDHLLDIARAPG